MKVLLAFAGSRGDAQPGTLLGRELTRRGHDVTLAVSPNLVEFAAGHGSTVRPFGLDSADLLRAQRADAGFTHPNPMRRMRAVRDLQRRGFAEAARDLREIACDADLLVTGMACEEVAAETARHRGVPLAAMHFFPITPNRCVPVVPTPWGRYLPGWANRKGWQALTWARAWALAPEIAALRGNTAPGALSRVAVQAYDAELFPGLRRDLGTAQVTGFPVTSLVEAPDPELADWLIAGSAPVYAGFGSMPVDDAQQLEELLRTVCRRRGTRLLLAGSMFQPGYDAQVAVVGQVEHRSVLPLCAVAVHHGGAGTTAAALRAGVPSVICSVQADQPYWGRQLEAAGLGVTMPFARLTADRLERLLARAAEPTTVLRAASYAARFRDDGVARAADVVESLGLVDRVSYEPITPVSDSATTSSGGHG